MNAVVPHRFLFRYSMPVRYLAGLPRPGRKLLNLPADCALPKFSELDDEHLFGEIRMAWNSGGLGISVQALGKKQAAVCNPGAPEESDGLQVWIDTRNTQSIHRASRFCHQFCLLPSGAGEESDKPVVIQLPIARAREDARLAKADDIRISSETRKNGYQLEAWISRDILNGFDPEANSRLGFYWYLRDSELGEQFLSVGREFPFASDPSLWATLTLER